MSSLFTCLSSQSGFVYPKYTAGKNNQNTLSKNITCYTQYIVTACIVDSSNTDLNPLPI